MITAIIYLLALTGAEATTTFLSPLAGIILYFVVFLALVLQAALAGRYPYRSLMLSLTLVPLVRIISLSMPLVDIPQVYWYPIIYGPLFIACLVVMGVLNQSAAQAGLVLKKIPQQLAVMLTGVPLGIVEYLILSPEPLIDKLTWQEAWLPAIILVACTGFVEELIFRGVLQRGAVDSLGRWGIVYVSVIFAVLHMGYLSWVDTAFVFAAAMYFGWVVNKTGSLAGVTLAHGITNVTLYLVMPFLA